MTITPKERPILFSAPMVRAILDGRKTQTRRIMKPQPTLSGPLAFTSYSDDEGIESFWTLAQQCPPGQDRAAFKREAYWWHVRCPYGKAGHLLWVRETWKYWDWTSDGMPWIRYAADEKARLIERGLPDEGLEDIWADLSETANYDIDGAARDRKWRPSIHMPRWASRITLRVTGVRIERLQDIGRGDAMREGCPFPNMANSTSPRDWFATLWESINGGGSWDANPYVWVVEFERAS